MILFLTIARENLLDAVVNKLFLGIDKIHLNSLESFVLSKGNALSHAKYLVIDLAGLIDSDDEIVQSLNHLKTIYDMHIVVLADKEEIFEGKKELLRRICEKGVYNIAVSPDEIEHCIIKGKTQDEAREIFASRPKDEAPSIEPTIVTDLPRPGKREPPATPSAPPRAKILAKKDFRQYNDQISIGVCGTETHVGCTHNALLIARFLKDVGFKVAYLEAGGRDDIKYLNQGQLPHILHNAQKNLLQVSGVNLFYSGFDMVRMMAEKCDFYVFDLGAFTPDKAELFLMRNIRVMVGGSKPWEMQTVKWVARELGGVNAVHYLLNFAIPTEKQKLLNDMGDASRNTYFTEYAPDPFTSDVNLEAYTNIFKEYIQQDETESAAPLPPQKKKGLFW